CARDRSGSWNYQYFDFW
nr:immunoglobulin heavy chain junction region [Macaca mulatta]